MLIDRYSQPIVVVATAAPGLGYPKVSINGSVPVQASKAAQVVGEGFYSVQLSRQETSKLGTLLIVFAPNVGTVLQVRDIVTEIAQETRVVSQNAGLGVQQLNTIQGTMNTARDQIMAVLQTILGSVKPRQKQ